MLSGYHSCTGPWRVWSDKDSYIDLAEDIQPLLYGRDPQLISHDDVAWWYMDTPQKKIDDRYHACNIRIPGIVALEVVNPYNKKYRMIDGSHRMAKMLLETNIKESLFYVISKDEFYSTVKDYDG